MRLSMRRASDPGPAAAAALPAPRVCPDAGRAGVPRQHLHHQHPVEAVAVRWTRAATSSSRGPASARTAATTACSASASTPPARGSGGVPRQHGDAVTQFDPGRGRRPQRRLRRRLDRGCAGGIGDQGPPLRAARARRRAPSSRSTPTRRAPSAMPAVASDAGRQLRRGLAERRARTATGYGVFGRRFDAGGTSLGPDFQVNTYTTGDQSRPDVASTADGGFVVVCQRPRQLRQRHPRAGASTPTGAPVGAEFSVVTTLATPVRVRRVRGAAAGRLRRGLDELCQDGSHNGIFGRMLRCGGESGGGRVPRQHVHDERADRIRPSTPTVSAASW